MTSSIAELSPTDGAAEVAGGALLLDVREADEWAAGHAPNAIWIPLGELPERLDEVPADRTVVAICRAGGRSMKAAEFLAGAGRTVVNLRGGMQSWSADGLDVTTDAGTAGTVI